MIRHAVFAIALGVNVLVVRASAQEAETPAAFAVTYVAAMQSADWARVAAYMHPEALGQFKSMFGELSALDRSGQLYTVLLGVADSTAYAAATPESIFGAFMRVISQSSPELGTVLAGSTVEVIGTVDESKTGVTHLVYRMHTDLDGVSLNRIQVMPLKQHEGAWRVMLSGEIEGMATAMKQQLMQRGR